MPERNHLHRLSQVWIENPLYFLTTGTAARRPILIQEGVPALLIDSWTASFRIHGWAIGRYVIMPDHVHFFARCGPEAKPLSGFMRDWKSWTAQNIVRIAGATAPIWQPEFFDHVLRSADSYAEKWHYVSENPVRAKLANTATDWPHAGECEHLEFHP